MRCRTGTAGFTLVEVLVSLLIVAIGLGVVSGALIATEMNARPRDEWLERLDDARKESIETGRAVLVWPDSAHERGPVRFLPDGRVVGELRAPGTAGVSP